MSSNGSDRCPRPDRRRGTRVAALGALAVTGLAMLAGCSSEELPNLGMPDPMTEEGDRVVSLWQGSWIAAFAVGGIVWGLIIWSVIFFRRSRHGDRIPPQTRYNIPIEVLYTVVPFIIIAVLFYFTARDEAELLKLSEEPDETVNVVARQWSWSFNYKDHDVWDAGTPGQRPVLYLPQGETVRFELTSLDVIHSFWIPKAVMKMDVIPGRLNQFEVTPERLGEYGGKCAELCGVDHARMLFDVRVVTAEEYEQHMAELEAKGQTGTIQTGSTDQPPSAQLGIPPGKAGQGNPGSDQ